MQVIGILLILKSLISISTQSIGTNSIITEIVVPTCCPLQGQLVSLTCEQTGRFRNSLHQFPQSYIHGDGFHKLQIFKFQFFGNYFQPRRSSFVRLSRELHETVMINGSIFIDGVTYDLGSYCINRLKPLEIGIYESNVSMIEKKSVGLLKNEFETMRQCCPPDHYLELSPYIPSQYSCNLINVSVISNGSETIIKNKMTTKNSLSCPIRYFHHGEEKWFRVTKDGTTIEVGLNFWLQPAWLQVSQETYCLGKTKLTLDEDDGEKNVLTDILLYCNLENFDAYRLQLNLYGGLYIVSIIFGFLNWMVYLAAVKQLNTHGCAQFSFFTALFLFYAFEGSRVMFKRDGLHYRASFACFIHAVIAQFLFIVLNTTSAILGFDLLLCFRDIDPQAHKVKNYRRLFIYLIVGWFLPFIFMSVGLTIHHFVSPNASDHERGIYEYAYDRCASPLWDIGFYVQIFLYIINIFLFISATIFIYRHRKKVHMASFSKSKHRIYREMVSVYMRLFLVLGMNWVTIAVDFLAGQSNPLAAHWVTFRVINILMGVVYFGFFGCSPKNVALLCNTYPCLKKLFRCVKVEDDNTVFDTQTHRPSKIVFSFGTKRASAPN